jgi:hypothetical protein
VGTTYYYKIVTKSSISDSYNSYISTVYKAVTSTATACSFPTTISSSTTTPVIGTTVTLSWSGAAAVTNNPITGYQIYRATVYNGTYSLLTSVSTSSTSGSKSGIAIPASVGGNYFFKIKTIGTISGYDSAISTNYVQITTTVSPCTAPTHVNVSTAVVPALSQVLLHWEGATKGGSSAITGYVVYRDTSPTGAYSTNMGTITTSETSGTLLVVAPDTGSYYYKVVTLGDTEDYTSPKSSVYASLTVGSAPVVTGTGGMSNAKGWW